MAKANPDHVVSCLLVAKTDLYYLYKLLCFNKSDYHHIFYTFYSNLY